MEESDNMLITTMKQYISLPENVINLKDIKTEEIFSISLRILEYLKFDTAQIKSLSGKQQKFRSMAKLNQCLQMALQIQFQLNQLMNPSIPFLRKYILTLINKLGSAENPQKSKMLAKKQTAQKGKQNKLELKKWLNQEWIHPSLMQKKSKYKGYLLPLTINKNMLKNNINLTAELNNSHINHNTQSIINLTEDKLNQRIKQFEANEGFSRKQYEQSQIRLQNVIKANKDDWFISSNKLLKLKKKIMEAQNANESEIQPPPMVGSVFKQQLQQASVEAEKKKKVQQAKPKRQQQSNQKQQPLVTLNPMQLLKKQAQNKRNQYQSEIQDILNDLRRRKQAIDSWERHKEEIQNQTVADEQKITKLKQETADLKKQVEKKQATLLAIQGEKDIQQQVKKLQGEIEMIESQVKQQVQNIQKQIKEVQVDSKQKMQALGDLKAKLSKIQSQYTKICQQIIQKEQLKGNVKIMKSGISRLYYHKKISEIESRWRETSKETKKLNASLLQLRQKTRISTTLSARVQTQIQNILNVQKTRNEPQVKQLKQLMTKCKDTYQNTLRILQQVNQVKLQTQDYQVRVHTLSGKNYKQGIDRIMFAMQDIKKEIAQLSKSKLK